MNARNSSRPVSRTLSLTSANPFFNAKSWIVPICDKIFGPIKPKRNEKIRKIIIL